MNSKLKSDFDKQVQVSNLQDVRLDDLESHRRNMKNQMEEQIKERNKMVEDEHNFIEVVKKDNENKNQKLQTLIKINSDRIKELKNFAEETKMFEDGCLNQIDKLNSRVDNTKAYINVELRDLNIKISQDMDDLVTDYKKLNDQTYTEVSDQIDKNSKKLYEIDNNIKVHWKKTVEQFEKNISDFKQDLNDKLEKLNQVSKQRTNKIKNICIDYFSKHEDNVTEIQSKVSGVTKAFDDWKMYVMNPQSINEARIHSLDVK